MDVFSNCLQFGFIANDMIVKTWLPELVSADVAKGLEVAEGGTVGTPRAMFIHTDTMVMV